MIGNIIQKISNRTARKKRQKARMINEFQTIFVMRSRRFDTSELEIVRCYLTAIYGYSCMRHGATLQTLRSVIETDHINGNPYDCRLINLQLICKSCNIAKYHTEDKKNITHNKSEMSYEQKVFSTAPKLLKNWINTRIKLTGHCCVEEAISDGAKHAGCHRVTAQGYIKMEKGSELGLYRIEEFKCDSPICEGESIFHKNTKPVMISGEGDTAKYILEINDEYEYDQADAIIDKEIVKGWIPIPTKHEIEIVEKMHLQDHITQVFENIIPETRKFRMLGKNK